MTGEISLLPHKVELIRGKVDNIPDNIVSIKAPELWCQGYKGQGVKIAIIDSGCQIDHENLKDRIVGGRNFTTEDGGDPNQFNDYNGHGTHVAGIIAANGRGGGLIGVAPEAELLILKIMDKDGRGSIVGLVQAINYTIAQQVDIITMSLGGQRDFPRLYECIKKAIAKNIVVVCAAANSGDGNPATIEYAYPAYYPEVISVGAQQGKAVARFSNSNDRIDLIAPGVKILSTYLNGGYARQTGTSMAAPHVAGSLALLINWGEDKFGRRLNEKELYAQLIRRTISLGYASVAEGNGMLYLTAPDILQEMLQQNRLV